MGFEDGQFPLLLLKSFIYLAFTGIVSWNFLEQAWLRKVSVLDLIKPLDWIFLGKVLMFLLCVWYYTQGMEHPHQVAFKVHELLTDGIKIYFCFCLLQIMSNFSATTSNLLGLFGILLVVSTVFDLATQNAYKVIYFFELLFYGYSFFLCCQMRALTMKKMNWSKVEMVNLVKFNLIFGLEVILFLTCVLISVANGAYDFGFTSARVFELKFLKYFLILLQYYIFSNYFSQTISNIEFEN